MFRSSSISGILHLFANRLTEMASDIRRSDSTTDLDQSDIGPKPSINVNLQALEDRVLYSAAPVPLDLVGQIETIELAIADFDLLDTDEGWTGFESSLYDSTTESHTEDWNQIFLESEVDFVAELPEIDDAAANVRRELVAVDRSAEGYQELVDDLLRSSSHDRSLEIVYLDSSTSGIATLTARLAGDVKFDAIHLVSHGSDGSIQLGSDRLDTETLSQHATEFSSWRQWLSVEADLFIYGCEVAGSETGEQLVSQLAALTGADVAASDDITGHADLGGDWDFEYIVGQVETDIAFSQDVQMDWQHRLLDVDVTNESGAPTSAIGVDDAGRSIIVLSTDDVAGSVGQDVYVERTDQFGTVTAFRVNETTAGDQLHASVAVAANGTTGVVWTSVDSGERGVYAKFYDGNGQVLRAEFRVDTTIASFDADDAAIAIDSVGNMVIVWETGDGGPNSQIFGQRFHFDGTVDGSQFQVSDYSLSESANPDVAMNDSGQFIVSWDTFDGGDFDPSSVYARTYNNDGTPQGNYFEVQEDTFVRYSESAVDIDSSGQSVIGFTSSTAFGVGLRVESFSFDGTHIGDYTNFYSTSGTQHRTDIVLLENGEFTVSWEGEGPDPEGGTDDDGVYFATIDLATGTIVTAQTHMNLPGGTSASNLYETSASLAKYRGTETVYGFNGETNPSGTKNYQFQNASRIATEAPTGTDSTLAIQEGGRITLTLSDLGYSDTESAPISQVQIAQLPTEGQLLLDGVVVIDRQVILASDISANRLVYIPEIDFSGDETLQFFVHDGQIYSDSFNTITFSVAPVIDQIPILIGDTLLSVDGGSQVNQTRTGEQSEQHITALNDGGYVIVWQSQDADLTTDNDGDGNNDDGVQSVLQQYDASGNRVGSERLIGAHAVGDQTLPELTTLGDGGYVVVWTAVEGTNFSVFGQRFDAAGNTLNLDGSTDATGIAIFEIAEHTQVSQKLVTVNSLSDGGFVASWSTLDQTLEADNSLAAVARIYGADGTPGSEFLVNETITGGQSLVESTQLNDGNLVFTWLDFASNSLHYRIFDPSGNALTAEALVSATGAADQFSKSIIASADGGFTIVWQQNEGSGNEIGIAGRRFDADGIPIDAVEIPLNAFKTDTQDFPDIVGLKDGTYVVFWQTTLVDGDGRGIAGRRFDSDLTPLGDEFVVNSRQHLDQLRPQATLLDSGEIVVVFTSADGDNDGAGFSTGIVSERLTMATVVNEDQPIPLPLSFASLDADGSESFTQFDATNLPAGVVLTDGIFSATSTSTTEVFDITGWDHSSLQIIPPSDFIGDIQLELTSVTQDDSGSQIVTSDPVTNLFLIQIESQNDVATYSIDSQVSTEDGNVTISPDDLFDANDDPDNAHINPTSTPSSAYSLDPATTLTDTGTQLLWESDFGPSDTISLDKTHVTFNETPATDYPGILASVDFDGSGGGTFTYPGSATDSLGVELWFRPDNLAAAGTLLEIGSSTAGFGIYLNNGNVELHVHAQTTSGGQTTEPYVLLGGALSTTEFNQVIVVISGSGTLAGNPGEPDVALYVNGQLVDLLADATTLSGVSALTSSLDASVGQTDGTFAHATLTSAAGFVGSIGKLTLTDQAIDSQEAEALFLATAHGAHVTTLEGQPLSIGTPVTLASGALVTYNSDGTFTYDSNGQFEHLPEYDQFDSDTYSDDSFSIDVSDGQGDTQAQTVVVRVTGSNDAPELEVTASAASIPSDTAVGTVVAQANATDVDDGESLSYSLAGTVSGAFSIDSASGEIKVANVSILKNPPGGLPHVVTVQTQDQEGVIVQKAVTLELSVSSDSKIAGVVADDQSGDGSISGDSGILGATVLLYRDSGNGIRDASDVFVRSTTTDSDGNYEFARSDLEFGKFYVVVDSRSIEASNIYNTGFDQGDVWAEQTYGSAGALYLNDSNVETISTGGTLFGGHSGTTSDDASSLVTAEHVTVVDVTTSTAALASDFGFSFNVMTNVEGGDDTDADATADRTVQGSLRQFIQNANAIDGANALRFVPRVEANAADNTWWTLTISEALPGITDSDTIIDGTAYELDGTSLLNLNTRLLGLETNVGTGVDGVAGTGDEYLLTQLDAPELEIVADLTVSDANRIEYGLVIEGTSSDPTVSDVTIRNLSIHGFGPTTENGANILVAGTGQNEDSVYQIDNVIIENNLIGSAPSLFATTLDTASGSGDGIRVINADNGIIRNNLIGNHSNSGIKFLSDSSTPLDSTDDWLIERNEIRSNSQRRSGQDGIDLVGANGTTIRENLLAANQGYGIDTYNAIGNFQINDNTIIENGGGGVETGGIRLFGDGSTVIHNQITNNQGSGINVVASAATSAALIDAASNNKLSQNQFSENTGLAIDLAAAINDGKSFAELDVVSVNGNLTGSEIPDGMTLTDHDANGNGSISESEFNTANRDIQRRGDGLSPIDGLDVNDANQGLDRVTLQDTFFGNNQLTVILLIPASQGIDQIEVYAATPGAGDSSGGNSFGEGARYLGTLAVSSMTFDNASGTWTGSLPEPAIGWPVDINNSPAISLLTFAGANTSEFSNNAVVNDLPTSSTGAAIEIDEDGSHTFNTSEFPFSDSNIGDSLTAIRIDTLSGNGTLKLSGGNVVAGQTILVSEIPNLVFEPVPNEFGTNYSSFEYSVSDGQHFSASTYTISFDVNSINDLPTGADKSITIDEDTPHSFTANDFGYSDVESGVADGSIIIHSISLGSLDLNGSPVTTGQEIAGNELANLVFRPTLNESGTSYAVITFTAKDSDGASATASNTITIDVTPVYDAPEINSDSYSVNEDGNLVIPDGANDLLANDIDFDGSTLQIVSGSVTAPSFGTLAIDPSTGAFTYTPDANAFGTEVVNYQVSDGTFSYSSTLTINVIAFNDQPEVVASATIDVNENTSFVTTLTGTDIEDGTISEFAIVGGSDHSKFSIDDAGVLSFVNPPNYEAPGDANADREYRVRVVAIDSGGHVSSNQLIQVNLRDQNEVPEGPASWTSEVTGDSNTRTGVVNLSTLVSDPDGDAIDIVLTKNTTYGDVQIDSSGQFTYTADEVSPTGFDVFEYKVIDSTGRESDTLELRISLQDFVFVAVEASEEVTADEDATTTREDNLLSTPPSTGSDEVQDSASSLDAGILTSDSITTAGSTGPAGIQGDKNDDFTPDLGQFELEQTYVTAGDSTSVDLLQQIGRVTQTARTSETTNLDIEVLASVFWDELNSSKRDYLYKQVQIGTPEIAASAATLLTMSYLVWNLASGILFTTFMSSLPAWSSFDILPVIAGAASKEEDGESIEQMVDA